MIYIDPANVTAPKDTIDIVEIIYDGGINSVSIARLLWEGDETFGIRWNISKNEWENEDKRQNLKRCIGLPVSFGHPVWFILPMDDPQAVNSLIQIFQQSAF